MKKILLILGFVLIGAYGFSQYTPLSTILTYFETGDKPTQAQFETSWRNAYNAVSDGMWDLTGYPSIGFVPYTSIQVGKFFQAAGHPTDTTVALGFNGTLKLSQLYVGGQKYTGSGSSAWNYSGGIISTFALTDQVAIGATTTSGYDLFVAGTTFSTASMKTNTLDLENLLGLNGSIAINSTGDMVFIDENNLLGISLSSLGGAASWTKAGSVIHQTVLTDSVSLFGANPDSAFNVFGTSYFENQAYFDSTVHVSGVIASDRYVETPSLNFEYGANSGRIDLYDATGKMKLYDSDYPSGVTLSQLNSGEWVRTGSLLRTLNATDNLVVGGTTANSAFDLSVVGNTSLLGTTTVGSGITMTYGSRINFSNGWIGNGANGLEFNDGFTGTKTLTELLGIEQDSMSVSRMNVDTLYFNGVTTKAIYSPHNNNIYAKSNSEEWRFEEFEGGATDYGVFHSNAFLFSNLIPDAMQVYSGFAVRGRVYMSDADTTIKYFTGKTSEWRTLATEDWVTAAILGGIGGNPTFDTVRFSGNASYLTTNSTSTFEILPAGATTPIRFTKNSSPQNNTLTGVNTITSLVNMNFTTTGANKTILGFRSDTLTLANDSLMVPSISWVRKYVSTHGAGGAGTPGGSANDLQYNNGGSFGGFWAYDGTNIVPTTATGLEWSANSFIKGHTADSVIAGKTVNVTNAYAAETGIKQNFKSLQAYAGGYLNSLSNVYVNYNDANANSGNAYGVYSHLYSDENYAASANTSYSNAGRFILQNRGTTTIGGGSPGTVYMNGIYAEISGTINVDATPGTYIVSAIYAKDNNAGSAVDYAGYFDGNVTVNGLFAVAGGISLGNNSDIGVINTSDWDISSTGVMTGISGITNNAAITSTGGIVSLNASSNFAVNVATGTSTGAISLGGGSNTVAVNSTSWDISTAGAVSGLTTMSMSGQLTSTLAIGTSPFAVTSTTVNTNLNADLLDGQTGTYYTTATNLTGTLPGDRGITAGSASSSFVEYNGTTATAGQWDGGSTFPTGTTVLNYGGYLKSTRLYATTFYSNALTALTDTVAAVWYPGGKLDSAQFAFSASKGWEIELEDFDTYYSKAEQLKALPLPYPNGTERRKMNAFHMAYQVEFELERLTRYFKEERDKNKILTERIAKLEKNAGIKLRPNRKKRS